MVIYLVTRAFHQWVSFSGSWSLGFAADGATSDQEESLDGTRSKLDEDLQSTISIKAAGFITILIALMNFLIRLLIFKATLKVTVLCSGQHTRVLARPKRCLCGSLKSP